MKSSWVWWWQAWTSKCCKFTSNRPLFVVWLVDFDRLRGIYGCILTDCLRFYGSILTDRLWFIEHMRNCVWFYGSFLRDCVWFIVRMRNWRVNWEGWPCNISSSVHTPRNVYIIYVSGEQRCAIQILQFSPVVGSINDVFLPRSRYGTEGIV